MFNIGTQELLIILLLVFLLFGPRHIPEVAHTLGKGLGDLRRALQGVEDNVRRAGGDIPRLPPDLADLDREPPRRPLTSVDRPGNTSDPDPPPSAAPASPSDPAKPEGREGGSETDGEAREAPGS